MERRLGAAVELVISRSVIGAAWQRRWGAKKYTATARTNDRSVPQTQPTNKTVQHVKGRWSSSLNDRITVRAPEK